MLDTSNLIGRTVYSQDGDKIGDIGQVYVDDQTSEPEFITVKTGLFGRSESFVPIQGARDDGDKVTVPFTKDKVKDAPSIDDHGHIPESREGDVFRYYGLHQQGTTAGHSTQPLPSGERVEGRTTTAGDSASEPVESHQRGTESQGTGGHRLRKYVVTEQVSVQVPVTRETTVVERDPGSGTDEGQALGTHRAASNSESDDEAALQDRRPATADATDPAQHDLGKRHVDRGRETPAPSVDRVADLGRRHVDRGRDTDNR